MSFKVTFSLICSVILAACAQNDERPTTILTNRQNNFGELEDNNVDYEHDTNNYQDDIEVYSYDHYGYGPEHERNILKHMDTALAAIYGIIAIVGLVANGVVFFVIFGGNEIKRTVTALYVAQLAFADSLFLLTLPIMGMQKVTRTWSFGQGLCSLCESLKYFNYFAGIFFLTAMSVDRYIAVARSAKAHQLRTKKRSIIACVIVWAVAAIMATPILFYAKTEKTDETVYCRLQFPGYTPYSGNEGLVLLYFDRDINETKLKLDYLGLGEYEEVSDINYQYYFGSESTLGNISDKYLLDHMLPEYRCLHKYVSYSFTCWILIQFFIGFLLPFVIITISYVLIIKRLRINEEKMAAHNTGKKSFTMRKKVTQMVAALVICFVICWLPYHIFMLVKIVGFSSSVTTCNGVGQFFLALGFSNSALNPILYTFLGHNFKQRFQESVDQVKKKFRRSSAATATGHFTRSHSDRGHGVSFSKKIGNIVGFRKASRTSNVFIDDGDSQHRKKNDRRNKKIKDFIPLLNMNNRSKANCDLHDCTKVIAFVDINEKPTSNVDSHTLQRMKQQQTLPADTYPSKQSVLDSCRNPEEI